MTASMYSPNLWKSVTFIGVYPLSLISRRKGNWSHVGSIPITPTK